MNLNPETITILIPARLGSKGLPGKNRKLIDYLLKIIPSEFINSTWISTDDPILKEKCMHYGINIHNRSNINSSDTASTKKVVHEFIHSQKISNTVIMLYLTYPERTWHDVVNAYTFYKKHKATSLLCKKDIKQHPYLMLSDKGIYGEQLIKHNLYRRQDYPKVFEISHYISIFEPWKFQELNNNMYNEKTIFFKIPDVIDVDTDKDLQRIHSNAITMESVKDSSNKLHITKSESILKYHILNRNSDIAFFMSLDNKYFIGYEVFIKSLLRNNPWFNLDIIILDVGISEEIKTKILCLYKNTIFIKPFKENYSKINLTKVPKHFHVNYYKFDAFLCKGYKKIITIDTDMLIQGDIKSLINTQCIFGAVNAFNSNIDDFYKNKYFNGGLTIIDESLINNITYKNLLNTAIPGHNMAEQDVLNIYFKNDVTFLPKTYNYEKRMIHSKKFPIKIADVKIIHYVSYKPWETNKPVKEQIYKEIEKLWWDEYNRK